MLLNRAAQFFDPDTTWQLLASQPTSASSSLLLEQHVKRYGETDLCLGLVVATGERGFWLKTPGQHSDSTVPSACPTRCG